MTCLKRLNKAGLELRPKPSALAVHCLLPLVELCWAWGRGSGLLHSQSSEPRGPCREGRVGVGRGGGARGEGGVVQRLLIGCCLRGEDPLLPPRGVCFPTTAFVDMPCLTKIYRLLCCFKVK